MKGILIQSIWRYDYALLVHSLVTSYYDDKFKFYVPTFFTNEIIAIRQPESVAVGHVTNFYDYSILNKKKGGTGEHIFPRTISVNEKTLEVFYKREKNWSTLTFNVCCW